jgi:5-methylcytosine-specific restriction endonuclease McrA
MADKNLARICLTKTIDASLRCLPSELVAMVDSYVPACYLCTYPRKRPSRDILRTRCGAWLCDHHYCSWCGNTVSNPALALVWTFSNATRRVYCGEKCFNKGAGPSIRQ